MSELCFRLVKKKLNKIFLSTIYRSRNAISNVRSSFIQKRTAAKIKVELFVIVVFWRLQDHFQMNSIQYSKMMMMFVIIIILKSVE